MSGLGWSAPSQRHPAPPTALSATGPLPGTGTALRGGLHHLQPGAEPTASATQSATPSGRGTRFHIRNIPLT